MSRALPSLDSPTEQAANVTQAPTVTHPNYSLAACLQGDTVMEQLQEFTAPDSPSAGAGAAAASLSPQQLAAAVSSCAASLAKGFDRKQGGFGPAPKFPRPSELNLMLRTALLPAQVRGTVLFGLAHSLLPVSASAANELVRNFHSHRERYRTPTDAPTSKPAPQFCCAKPCTTANYLAGVLLSALSAFVCVHRQPSSPVQAARRLQQHPHPPCCWA
jgi:hypothetical protein